MKLKQGISTGLRKFGLLGLSDRLRFTWQRIQYAGMNGKFRKNNPTVKFPPSYFIYETYRLNYPEYYNDGRTTASELAELLKKHMDFSSDASVLDWGCGPARLVRHFPLNFPQADIHGTDYNREYIEWCRENIPEVKFSVNGIAPPLSYDDNYFNAITGLSIFTHLSYEMHEKWLDELYRVLKSDGMLLITTQGYGFRYKLLEQEQHLFDAGQIVVRKNFREGHRLYAAFQPRQAVHRLIENKFSIAAFIEGKNKGEQDIWLLRKQREV